MNNSYPRVLIVGETFRKNGGGGITLINLFSGWPAERLAVITPDCSLSDSGMCRHYYQLGGDELQKPWPFSIFGQPDASGDFSFPGQGASSKPAALSEKYPKTKRLYSKLLNISGLTPFINRIRISRKLEEWISGFDPEIIYLQVPTIELLRFSAELAGRSGKKYVIHFMDDYVRTMNPPNLLFYYWKQRISRVLGRAVRNASGILCISDAMSLEYSRRYGKNCFTFRNPVDLSMWSAFQKKDWQAGEVFRILYTGRLFFPTLHSVYDFCRITDKLRRGGLRISLDIFSLDRNPGFEKSIGGLTGIAIKPAVDYKAVPELISNYDLLLLPLDFTRKGITYTQYSISTKTSEYMISGVPVIVFALGCTALSEYGKRGWAFTAGSKEELEGLLPVICSRDDLREQKGKMAMKMAAEEHNAGAVREQFRAILEKIKSS